MTPTADLTSPFSDSLLNPEEISFLLRPNQTDGLFMLAAARFAADPDFNRCCNRMVRQYAETLQKLLHCRVRARYTVEAAAATPPADDLVFKTGTENVFCRLSKADAAVLTAAALGVSEGGFCSPSGGISFRLLNFCLQPLIRDISRFFPASVPQTQNISLLSAVSRPDRQATVSLLLQLDIRRRTIKLNLTFGIPIPLKLKYGAQKNVSADRRGSVSACLRRGIAAGDICLTAQTVPTMQPLSQVTRWQKGTFVPLGMKPDDPVRLSSAGLPEFKAVIGRRGERIAVKLNHAKVTINDKC